MVVADFSYDVTVVVPVYNGAQYVNQCFQSILGQKTDCTIQVLFVNDGSIDSSEDVIRKLVDKYPNVSLVTQRNQGLGPARNTGIENAKGKYIAFLDVDDHFTEGHIDKLFHDAEENDCDICFGGYTIARNASEKIYPNHYLGRCFDSKNMYVYYEKIFGAAPTERVEDLVPVSSCFGLYKTSFLRNTGVKFLPILSEDTVFNAEIVPQARKLFCSGESGYIYSMDNLQSITRKFNHEKKHKMIVFFSALLKVAEITEKETGRDDLVLRVQRKIISNTRGHIIFVCSQKQLSKSQIFAEIEYLLKAPAVVDALDAYPVEKLDFKYGLFAYLMKSNHVHLLILFSKLASYLKSRRN